MKFKIAKNMWNKSKRGKVILIKKKGSLFKRKTFKALGKFKSKRDKIKIEKEKYKSGYLYKIRTEVSERSKSSNEIIF